jgi:hypothetical protein
MRRLRLVCGRARSPLIRIAPANPSLSVLGGSALIRERSLA